MQNGKSFHGYTCPNCCNNTFEVITNQYTTGEGTLICAKCGAYTRIINQTEVKQFVKA